MLDLLRQPITLEIVREAARIQARNKFKTYFPDTGRLRRELYPKHIEYFAAGARHMERLAIAANRVGKSESIGAYEVTCHLTGNYPTWWPGRKFTKPVSVWAAGKTGETTRDIVQFKLLGQIGDSFSGATNVGLGTGMIPADAIVNTTPKQGLPRAVDTALIRHKSGGISTIGFKSYGKDRDSFEGTEKDVVWLDEEPPSAVKKECLMRLMTNNGLLIITFTPLDGYTEVVNEFLESSDPDKWYIQIGWKDAPHLTPEMIAKMSLKYLPYELKARSEGIPSAGEGVIYPIDVEELTVDDFKIPDYWPRAYGMDVGKTAVIWGALDRDTDVLYIYREYFNEVYNALIHSAAIKGENDRDKWIPGVIDPGSLGSSQVDGQKLFEIYTKKYGLNLTTADNSVEAGIYEVWARMCTHRIRFFRSVTKLKAELSRYRRHTVETKLGEHTQVVKKHDHLCDSLRYLVMSGIARMKTRPIPKTEKKTVGGLHGGYPSAGRSNYGWMGN